MSERLQRPNSPYLDSILGVAHPVLDHGHVRVIDYMGDDAAIVQAARVSYGKGTKTVLEDRALIRYLLRKKHTTPFEQCELKLHVKMPIVVARQWIRHRMASVNEYSARYSILDCEFYLPSRDALAAQSTSNRQGRGEELTPEQAEAVLELLRADATRCYANYTHLLNDDGEGNVLDEGRPQLARELARMNLTLNTYTQWYWKIDLHNLLHFLQLRMDSHAQLEIRVYAELIGSIVSQWVPHAWSAFEDYRLRGASLSRMDIDVLRALVQSDPATETALRWLVTQQPDMSARERNELLALLLTR